MKLLAPLLALLLALAPLARAQELPSVVAVSIGAGDPYAVALEALRGELADAAQLHEVVVDPQDDGAAALVAALKPQVLVPLGTRAASWCLEASEGTRIVFAMVLNPVNSGLVASMKAPGGRMTGAALDISPESQFEVLRDLVGAQRIAVLFDPVKTGLIVREARLAAKRVGVELVGIEVPDPTGLEPALQRVDNSFDALWSVADSTVLARGVVNRVLLHTLNERIPYMGLSEQYVRAGALVALAASYEENGRLAGQLVRRVLAGERPGSIAIAVPRDIEVVVNPKTARRLELDLSRGHALPLREIP